MCLLVGGELLCVPVSPTSCRGSQLPTGGSREFPSWVENEREREVSPEVAEQVFHVFHQYWPQHRGVHYKDSQIPTENDFLTLSTSPKLSWLCFGGIIFYEVRSFCSPLRPDASWSASIKSCGFGEKHDNNSQKQKIVFSI